MLIILSCPCSVLLQHTSHLHLPLPRAPCPQQKGPVGQPAAHGTVVEVEGVRQAVGGM